MKVTLGEGVVAVTFFFVLFSSPSHTLSLPLPSLLSSHSLIPSKLTSLHLFFYLPPFFFLSLLDFCRVSYPPLPRLHPL